MNTAALTQNVLMYFVLPLWLAAGFADYLCHRAVRIEMTSGVKESLLHLLQIVEVGVPILAVMFLEINALVIGLMIVCFVLHEITAIWDLSYATATRYVSPVEQHVHGYLQMLPLLALVLVVVLHWEQFLGLIGVNSPDFSIALKGSPLPPFYVAGALLLVLLFELLPYLEEAWRGMRARAQEQARRQGNS
jgi:hypothetical protein